MGYCIFRTLLPGGNENIEMGVVYIPPFTAF
jgi:hypothetical protein